LSTSAILGLHTFPAAAFPPQATPKHESMKMILKSARVSITSAGRCKSGNHPIRYQWEGADENLQPFG
jgi:hypothetical protein